MSAHICGCDPEAQHRCAQYPHCVVGRSGSREPVFCINTVTGLPEQIGTARKRLEPLMDPREERIEKLYQEAECDRTTDGCHHVHPGSHHCLYCRCQVTPDGRFPPNACVGIGGAPTRCTILPDDAAGRKRFPIATGVLDYFPDAIAALAELSYVGNEQHNPDQPLHWDRSKSSDEADTAIRHFMQRGTRDKDRVRHSVKAAWRMLAYLQKELEEERF